MSYELCKKIIDLNPYEAIHEDYKHKLDANESFIPIDDKILNQIKDKLGEIDFNRYPDPYCENLCECFSRFYGVDKSYITVGNGSDELISIITSSFLMSQDTVLTITPDFSMYKFYAHIAECNLVEVAKDSTLKIDIDTVIKAAKANNAKMIIFSNPCNPTSLGISREEIIRLLCSVDSLVVLDEAYMDFWNESLVHDIGEFDNLIILKTASKAWGMASIRLGFAIANLKLTKAMKAVKSPYNVNTVSQRIGAVIYSNKETLLEMRNKILLQRDYLYSELISITEPYNDIIVYPSCTNFVLIEFESECESSRIYNYLKENSVLVRCMGKYLRVTASSDTDINAFLNLLKKAIKI